MKELEWLESFDWLGLWHYARDKEYLTARKTRLLAVAACQQLRHLISDTRLLRMVDLGEEWADTTTEPSNHQWEKRELWYDEAEAAAGSLLDTLEQTAAWAFAKLGNDDHKIGRAIESVAAFYGCPAVTVGVRPGHCPQVSRLIREVVSNPFRPIIIESAWLTSTVVALAEGIYQDRAFDRLPILADALQDAGCDNEDVLNHCQGEGPHCRGCWVVDLLTGRN